MTPDDVGERLARWKGREGLHMEPDGSMWPHRRVECVEPADGVRAWLLWQDGRQVGNVRAWNVAAGDYELEMHASAWTIEASSGIAREALGLPEPDESD